MPSNFIKLNLGIPFVRSKNIIYSIRQLMQFDSNLILTPSLIHLMSELKLRTKTTVLYYPALSRDSNIHIDTDGVLDQTNLNLVIDTGSAQTNWYHPGRGYSGHASNNKFNDTRSYDISRMHLIESIKIVGVGLFQAGIPHNVSNITSNRWCVSVSLRTLDNKVIKWEEAIKIFDRFIVKPYSI